MSSLRFHDPVTSADGLMSTMFILLNKMEPEFDEERIPLLERDEINGDDSIYEDSQAETSFYNDDDMQEEAQKLNTEINALERGFNVKISPKERGRFRMSSGYLQIEKSPGDYVSVTKSNGEFLAESTMRTRLGASLARELLGIETPSSVRSRTRVLIQEMPTELEMDDLSPQKLEEVISEVTREMSTNTDLDMREFLGIDKALTRIKGELENNAGKLTEIDEHLEREERKLAEIETSPDLQVHEERVKAKIAELREERAARLEIVSQNRKELASQFSRIRQTVEKILDGDLNLKEKLKLILREHGLTITAVLTSLGLIISTIVSSLTGGAATGGSSTPPKNPNKVGEWIKNKLKALARLLGRLAGKAAAALPGIIGSIVVGILNFLKKIVTTAAGHVWLFLTSIATLIGYRLMYPPNSKKR